MPKFNYGQRGSYPLDLNPGENFSRNYPRKYIMPFPGLIGAVQVISRLFDAEVRGVPKAPAWGASTAVFSNTAPNHGFTQITYPTIPKVKG